MTYDLARLPVQGLLRSISDSAAALSRLDERVARSVVGAGWLERTHFSDACASLWIDGELVHIEDLVLHDAGHDIRTPTHELAIARDVLRMRRRIAGQPSGWALTAEGLRSLRSEGAASAIKAPETKMLPSAGGDEGRSGHDVGEEAEGADPLAAELAAIDAVLARSEAVLSRAVAGRPEPARERDPLVYDLDWDEDARLKEWQDIVDEMGGLPPGLQAIVALDAWNEMAVLQHGPWLGRLLSAAILSRAGLTSAGHLAIFNIGLRSVPVERRRHRDRDIRLSAIAQGVVAAAEFGLREHDRLALARQTLERKLVDRRASSKMPALVDLVIARPLISAGMIAETLDVTPQAARRIVAGLGLREMTGRGRFRAWGIV